jgi:hypothetical protein
MYMAEKEQRAEPDAAATFTVFFTQIAYIVMAAVVIFGRASLLTLSMIFGGVMLVGMTIQTVIAFAKLRLARASGIG